MLFPIELPLVRTGFEPATISSHGLPDSSRADDCDQRDSVPPTVPRFLSMMQISRYSMNKAADSIRESLAASGFSMFIKTKATRDMFRAPPLMLLRAAGKNRTYEGQGLQTDSRLCVPHEGIDSKSRRSDDQRTPLVGHEARLPVPPRRVSRRWDSNPHVLTNTKFMDSKRAVETV